MNTGRDGDVKDAVHHRMTSEPRTMMEGAAASQSLASTSRSQEGIIGTEEESERGISSELIPPTMTSSSSMELDLSDRERVAELARLDKVFIDLKASSVFNASTIKIEKICNSPPSTLSYVLKPDVLLKEHLEQVDAMSNFV